MKRIYWLFILVIFLHSYLSFAQINKEGTLLIPTLSPDQHPPRIDGILDQIWQNVPEILQEQRDRIALQSLEIACEFGFRVLVDEQNIYYFVRVFDDIIRKKVQVADPFIDRFYMCFSENSEIYNSFYDVKHGYQMVAYAFENRIRSELIGYDALPGNGTIKKTALGWNIEAFMPRSHRFDQLVTSDNNFGFELILLDVDTLKTTNNIKYAYTGWKSLEPIRPEMWGKARVSSREIKTVLQIPKAEFVPTIDGKMENEWWDVPLNTEAAFDKSFIDPHFNGSHDAWFDFRSMWSDEFLYLYVSVLDEEIRVGNDDRWINDGLEIYFDANNSKTNGAYDGVDDVQLRFNYGDLLSDIDISYGQDYAIGDWGLERPRINFRFGKTEEGCDFEAALPLHDLKIVPGRNIGFELQLNDFDGGTVDREAIKWWWHSSNTSWRDASVFGTAHLVLGTNSRQTQQHIASGYELKPNFPNPFNPATTIEYAIPRESEVNLVIYNMLGKPVRALLNDNQQSGVYQINWDSKDDLGKSVPAGVYFAKLKAGDFESTTKMILIK
ncbi:T9SS type A sorting domain-containing protein [candidate division KSB1 bacterium]|nr:T9SS type A sorting domain-containing protein [candidate division KSB1 bacterium]